MVDGADLAFRGRRVALPNGIAPATVIVSGGRVSSIEPFDATVSGVGIVDAGEALLMPGLVDTHVHVNEPGRTEWEGFATATRAAAAGGVTTLLDMPLNSIPATTTAEALEAKRAAARGRCHVDVGFIGGVVPGNAGALPALARGVLAWKCFLVDSGVPEFGALDLAELERVMPVLVSLGRPLMVHAELPGPIARARRDGPITRHADYVDTRPDAAEVDAIAALIALAERFATPVHVVHLATGKALPLLEAARARGVPITVETCPHYLTFASEEIPDRATEYKCAPPIRSARHRDALWSAIARGAIDGIVSDHSPSPPAMKHRETGDFAAAWGGIASLQVGFSAVWHGAQARGVPLARVVDAMSRRPADLVRLANKGRIAPGADADLVIVDPDAGWTVDAARLAHRHPITPYHGMQLPGLVRATYLRGRLIYDGSTWSAPAGHLLAPDA